jgi:CheY-like chemotaxis protein
MSGLVNDLLDVSRVTRGLVMLTKTALDLKSVVYSAVEQVRPFIEAQGHHLLVDLAPEKALVMGDQKRLVQIFTNLLNNAAKYTPPGGEIRLGLAVDGDALILSIEDNGIGMRPEVQAHVFELFTQAERTSDRTLGGLGIGLALAKNLTELHSGSIDCYSAGKDLGSTFTVRLPRLDSATASSEDAREADTDIAPAAQALRILVVDDNEDAAQMLALYLGTMGHHVDTAYSARAALAYAATKLPGVFILDIGLPEMDGNELAGRLRAQPETAGALLVALTGYGQENDKVKSLAAGFDHYMVKPVDAKQLVSLLEQHAVP